VGLNSVGVYDIVGYEMAGETESAGMGTKRQSPLHDLSIDVDDCARIAQPCRPAWVALASLI